MQFIGERYRVSIGAGQWAGPGFDRGLTGAVFLRSDYITKYVMYLYTKNKDR